MGCLLGLLLSFQVVAAVPPHPLLIAVCNNDYRAVANLSPENLDLDAITWGKRKITSLDLALANNYSEIANLLVYSGASVSSTSLKLSCNLRHTEKICARNNRWRQHQACRTALDPARWKKSCHAPDRYCKQILKQ